MRAPYITLLRCPTCKTLLTFSEKNPVRWTVPEELRAIQRDAEKLVEENPDGGNIIRYLTTSAELTEDQLRVLRACEFLHLTGHSTWRGLARNQPDMRRVRCPTCEDWLGVKNAEEAPAR